MFSGRIGKTLQILEAKKTSKLFECCHHLWNVEDNSSKPLEHSLFVSRADLENYLTGNRRPIFEWVASYILLLVK